MNERETMMQGKVKYFFMGGLIAASAALLLAPKSGRETRDYLSAKAKEGKDYVYKEAQEIEERFLGSKERLRTDAREILERAKELTKKEKDTILGAIESR